MNLYALLTATRVCQILDNHGWPALTVNVEENGWMMTMKTTMTTDALVKLISAMIERGRIGKEAMAGLTLLCDKNLVEATISAEVCGRDISIEVNLSGIPESQCLCHDYLKMVLEDDLRVICGDVWRDAETILLHTGARYEGSHVFERTSRNFIVAAEVLPELPPMYHPGELLLQAWLTEILVYSSDVLTIGLVVYRDYGMVRMSEFCLPEVCVIRPNTLVRHWLNRHHVTTVTGMARNLIALEKKIYSSFVHKRKIN